VGALVGTAAAHNLEYLRTFGPGEFPNAASRSVHTYLGPAGILLALLAVLVVGSALRIARLLESRLYAFATGSRANELDLSQPTRAPSLSKAGLVTLMWTVQVLLYLVQENVEAHVLGLHSPGLGAITGAHNGAVLVHLAVAMVLSAAVWVIHRPVTRLIRAVREAIAAFVARYRPRDSRPVRASLRILTPVQRFGVSLWGRPPPLLVIV
jgi:hypothetical protein